MVRSGKMRKGYFWQKGGRRYFKFNKEFKFFKKIRL